jgi:hypothetical protein
MAPTCASELPTTHAAQTWIAGFQSTASFMNKSKDINEIQTVDLSRGTDSGRIHSLLCVLHRLWGLAAIKLVAMILWLAAVTAALYFLPPRGWFF